MASTPPSPTSPRQISETLTFAEFISKVDYATAPHEVKRQVLLLLLDGIGCGVMAAHSGWAVRAVAALAPGDIGARGEPIWTWGRRADPAAAVTLNGSFVQGSELDDYNEFSPIHASSVVVPASWAAVGDGNNVQRFLDSILAGYETAARVGLAMGGAKIVASGWHSGAVYGPIAAAAAAGRAFGLDGNRLDQAIGIAATQAGGLMAAQYGGDVKRMQHGFASRNGYVAARLTSAGVEGIRGVFEHEYGGYASTFLGGVEHAALGQLTEAIGIEWRMLKIGVKFHACMIGLHSIIDGLVELRSNIAFDPSEVSAICVGLSGSVHRRAAFDLPDNPDELATQMNAAYVAAVAILDRQAWLEQFEEPRRFAGDVVDLRRRVHVFHDPAIDDRGPKGRLSSSLRVELKDGRRFDSWSPAPSQRTPELDGERVVRKFVDLVAPVLGLGRANRMVDVVMSLGETDDGLVELQGLIG